MQPGWRLGCDNRLNFGVNLVLNRFRFDENIEHIVIIEGNGYLE